MQTITLSRLSEVPRVAKHILDYSKGKHIFCFYGELGAGKTTLIKEMCKQLGMSDAGSSPTFSLVNEYITHTKKILYHFDLYRLKSETEIYDIGYEDYIYSGNYCFIEWPENIEHLLPAENIKIKITQQGNQRIISLS